MSDRNLQWAVSAEILRRGGHSNRQTRLLPGNIDGVVGQLREINKRTHGAHPLIPSNAWWRKTAGASGAAGVGRPVSARGVPGWEMAKREMDWNTIECLDEQFTPKPIPGKEEVDVPPSSRRGKAESDNVEIPTATRKEGKLCEYDRPAIQYDARADHGRCLAVRKSSCAVTTWRLSRVWLNRVVGETDSRDVRGRRMGRGDKRPVISPSTGNRQETE